MKRFLILTFAGLLFNYSSLAYAQANKVTLTSYYPAPFGAYERLRLVPRADLTGACADGSLYFKASDNSLQFCSGTVWGPLSSLWSMRTRASGFDPTSSAIVDQYYPTFPYPDLFNRKPFFGFGTNNPQRPVHITVADNGTPNAIIIENLGTVPGLGAKIAFDGVMGGIPLTAFVNLQATYQNLTAAAAESSLSIFVRDGAGALREHFVFKGNGFLGIREPFPAAILELAGNGPLGNNTLPLLMVSSNADAANNGNVLTITALGNVGINQTTPAEKLEVGGNIRATNLILASDAELKKDITPLKNALEKISRLKGVSFEWKDTARQTDRRKHMGVIAQDVEKVFPEAVSGKNGAKGVDYPALIAPLIEAVKELKIQNEVLNRQREEQSARIIAQQEKIDSLQNVCTAKEPVLTP